MKVIVAGGSDFKCIIAVHRAMYDSGFEITEVVTGGATGVDALAKSIAGICRHGHKEFIADWKSYGLIAGPMRNRKMAEYADALVAVWDGKSKDTANMINQATNLNLDVHIQRC